MTELAFILLGAALSFVATFLIERWKLTHASQTAALMIIRELEFHNSRLTFAIMIDQYPNAEYEHSFS